MAGVRHEVPAHLLDALPLGDVVQNEQGEPRGDAGRPRGDEPRLGRRRAALKAERPGPGGLAAADHPDRVPELFAGERPAAREVERGGGRRQGEHREGGVHDESGVIHPLEDLSNPLGDLAGRLSPGPIPHPERGHHECGERAPDDDAGEEGEQRELQRIHGHSVRVPARSARTASRAPSGGAGTIHRAGTAR